MYYVEHEYTCDRCGETHSDHQNFIEHRCVPETDDAE